MYLRGYGKTALQMSLRLMVSGHSKYTTTKMRGQTEEVVGVSESR